MDRFQMSTISNRSLQLGSRKSESLGLSPHAHPQRRPMLRAPLSARAIGPFEYRLAVIETKIIRRD